MSQDIISENNQPIILTTGIYDLIKDHIRRKKATPVEEEILRLQLKRAMQVPRKNLPSNVVTVDTRVTIKDHSSDAIDTYFFVSPDRAKKKNGTTSILSTMGLALVGCKEGDLVTWVFGDDKRQLEIVNVERMS